MFARKNLCGFLTRLIALAAINQPTHCGPDHTFIAPDLLRAFDGARFFFAGAIPAFVAFGAALMTWILGTHGIRNARYTRILGRRVRLHARDTPRHGTQERNR